MKMFQKRKKKEIYREKLKKKNWLSHAWKMK